MLYHFELQMAGVILLTTMTVCGISLWIKRRRAENNLSTSLNEPDDQSSDVTNR